MEKPNTQMGRILHEDNQETLLQAVLNDSVFGFVQCDVHTPRELIESFGEFLFPPLFCRMQITSDLVSDYMRRRMCEDDNERQPTTIVQRFNAKGIFLMTPLVKFYVSRGMKVSNITECIQYIGGEAFDSFVETCYRERVAATKAGDDTKANTIKNVQNNGNFISRNFKKLNYFLGYGKCGENMRRHKVHKIITDESKLYKQMAKPRFLTSTEILDENGEPVSWEVACKKKIINDDKPVHFSLAILQYSKLLFLR